MDKVRRDQAIFDISNADLCFSALANSTCQEIKIPRSALARNVFHKNKHRFSEGEADARIASDFELHNLVAEIQEISHGMLEFGAKGEPSVVFDRLPEWKALTLTGGQDLYILAQNPVEPFNWPSTINITSPELTQILKGGIAENHCHFSAMGPAFEFNWMYLHNGPTPFQALDNLKSNANETLSPYHTKDEILVLRYAALISVYLRRYLHTSTQNTHCSKPSFPSIRSINGLRKRDFLLEQALRQAIEELPCKKPNESFLTYDYVLGNKDEIDAIFGERYLISRCLQQFGQWNNTRKTIFYLYLILKRFIASFFIQNNEWYGFTNFERFERASKIFLPNDERIQAQQYFRSFSALHESPQKICKCEIRIAPKEKAEDIEDRLRLIHAAQEKASLEKNEPQFGILFHFIKKNEPIRNRKSGDTKSPIKIPCRSSNLYEEYDKQASAILKVLNHARDVIPIVGIDAANEEMRCRPEIFGPVYRRLRRASFMKGKPLGFSFHVGEDFPTLANGLRAIYEAITFLNLGKGDRLGHASALGVFPKDYFVLKGHRIFQTKQNQLDDYCFLYQMYAARYNNQSSQVLRFLKREAMKLLKDVYQSDNFCDYLLSLALRADHPDIYKSARSPKEVEAEEKRCIAAGQRHYISQNEDAKKARLSEGALHFVQQYHFNIDVRNEGDELFVAFASQPYLRAVDVAIEELTSIIANKGIAIETNPTSNYLIGPFSEFEQLPIFAFLGLPKTAKCFRTYRCQLTIGTDDPSVFSTTLNNEYASVYYSLKNWAPTVHNIVQIMQELAQSSLDVSFIKGMT